MIPESIVSMRRALCAGRCAVDPMDPCIACPNKHWPQYTSIGCPPPPQVFPIGSSELKPIPRNQWPLWAKALSKLSKPQDVGIGDTVKRLIGDETSETFKRWYKSVFNADCGCTGRQARWNIEYPLLTPA
jgi:hypothetical protein